MTKNDEADICGANLEPTDSTNRRSVEELVTCRTVTFYQPNDTKLQFLTRGHIVNPTGWRVICASAHY